MPRPSSHANLPKNAVVTVVVAVELADVVPVDDSELVAVAVRVEVPEEVRVLLALVVGDEVIVEDAVDDCEYERVDVAVVDAELVIEVEAVVVPEVVNVDDCD
jgi:hypothetical protein